MSTKKCKPIAKYPINVRDTGYGVVGRAPLICGGINKDWDRDQSECFVYDQASNSWKLHATLKRPRCCHASVVVDGSLWLLAGMDNHEVKSTEIVLSDGNVEQGPDLPFERQGSCAVKLSNDRVMIIGGGKSVRNDDTMFNVTIFDIGSTTFTTGPRPQYGRYYAACAVFNSPLHGNRPVVVVAGGNHYYGAPNVRNSEVLDYTNPNANWEICKCCSLYNF